MHYNHPQNINAFLEYLKFQKRYSSNTICAYETDLVSVSNYLSTQFNENDLNKATSIFIRSWLAGLKEEGISSRSINRKISTLKSYYKFQLRKGEVKLSPMVSVISPKSGRRLPMYVEKEGIDKLFSEIEFERGFKGITDKLILFLLYNTGIRRSELLNLKLSQVDFDNKNIKVFGKGKKERIIPISSELSLEINNYSKEKSNLENVVNSSVLLVTNKGKQLTTGYIYNVVKKYLSQVSTIEKRSPHILRHTFATHLMSNGADLNAVKELLGHSSLAATQVYTHNNIEKLKEIHKKAHPKS